MTAEERLHFAIQFARTDLTLNRPGDWLNIRDDFKEFLGRGKSGKRALKAVDFGGLDAHCRENPDELSEAQLIQAQEAMLNLLSPFAGGSGNYQPPEIKLKYMVFKLGETSFVAVLGNFQSCVIAILVSLISSTPPPPIKVCPDCGRLFYRVGKQIFCDRQCTNRAMTKRKRSRDKEHEEQRKQARPRKRRK